MTGPGESRAFGPEGPPVQFQSHSYWVLTIACGSP